MPVATFPLGPLETNSYLVHNASHAVAVDVGGDPAAMLAYLTEHRLVLAAVCLTHWHFDHSYGVAALVEATKAPVLGPEGDAPIRDTESAKGGIWGFPVVPEFESQPLLEGPFQKGGMECRVISTPGHTPGGMSLYFPAEKAVFVGDALFYRSIGRTDFPGGDHELLLRSIKDSLFGLPEETTVYPGHGPQTSIGDERKNNPFCGDFVR